MTPWLLKIDQDERWESVKEAWGRDSGTISWKRRLVNLTEMIQARTCTDCCESHTSTFSEEVGRKNVFYFFNVVHFAFDPAGRWFSTPLFCVLQSASPQKNSKLMISSTIKRPRFLLVSLYFQRPFTWFTSKNLKSCEMPASISACYVRGSTKMEGSSKLFDQFIKGPSKDAKRKELSSQTKRVLIDAQIYF